VLHRASRHGHKSSRSGGDSMSSGALRPDDDPEKKKAAGDEGEPLLRREKGSFTVHGKKASVITFGKEWEGMSAEERLKVRKQAHSSISSVASAGRPLSDASITPRRPRIPEAGPEEALDDAPSADDDASIDMLVEAARHLRTLRSGSLSASEDAPADPPSAPSRPTTRDRQSSLSSAASDPVPPPPPPVQGPGAAQAQNGWRVPPRRASLSLRDRRRRKNSAAAPPSASPGGSAAPAGAVGSVVEERPPPPPDVNGGGDGREDGEGGAEGKGLERVGGAAQTVRA